MGRFQFCLGVCGVGQGGGGGGEREGEGGKGGINVGEEIVRDADD